MGNFMEVQLGKRFLKLVNGGTLSTGFTSYWGGSIPRVTEADFTSRGIGEIRRYVSESGVRSSFTSVVDPGNLLVVTRTGVWIRMLSMLSFRECGNFDEVRNDG